MPPKDELTEGEMEVVTVVFKQYETGLREACITAKVCRKQHIRFLNFKHFLACPNMLGYSLTSFLQDLLPALVSLGLNIMEQEVIDMTNTIARNGLVYFPDFCQIVLKKFREDDEEQFAQVMFKVNMRIK